MSLTMEKLTPTQQRIYATLQDGERHPRTELIKLLDDDLGEWVLLQVHISNLRKKVHGSGLTIACETLEGLIYYRLVRRVQE